MPLRILLLKNVLLLDNTKNKRKLEISGVILVKVSCPFIEIYEMSIMSQELQKDLGVGGEW